MNVPNAEQAIIPLEKLTDSLLNLDHIDGGPKARWLLSAGFAAANPVELDRALRDQHLTQECHFGKPSSFSVKNQVTALLTGRTGFMNATSIWMVLHGKMIPRLVTVVPGKKS
ncbi:MAG: hypothetical protein IT427_19680 [Pirellulales bacterium]|nr:hypothetical protein [Pirellulales bacterium]